MSDTSIYLVGSLASHSRGKIVSECVTCGRSETLPDDHGLVLAFGTDFQNLTEDEQDAWVKWCEPAGRTLLLIPPYRIEEMEKPLRWRIYRPERVEVGRDAKVVSMLSGEIKFEFDTDLQIAHDAGGLSVSGGVNTAFFRKNPHSGLFAITSVPVWSLTVLDSTPQVVDWLRGLHLLAGEPVEELTEAIEPSEFVPQPNHFAVMLHLCERCLTSREEVLTTLAESPVLSMPPDVADSCLKDLEQAGHVSDCRLTKCGRETLLASSYGVYAEAMEVISE